MFKNRFRLLTQGIFSVLLFALACVEPYDKDFRADQNIIIIDAKLSTDAIGNYVYIYEAIPSSGSSTTYLPVSSAKVQIIEDDNRVIDLTESEKGYFDFPSGFAGKVGSTYQLKIQAKGQELISKKEIIPDGPEIKNIYEQFENEGLKDIKGNISPSQKVYIDTEDPVDSKNFYLWDWTLYEEQFWCKTCTNGLYYRDASTGPLGECRSERFNRAKLDYNCDSRCWEVIKANKINIMKDDFVNGKTITARQIANLPVYQLIGALIDVKQFSINESAYQYLNLVQSQGQNTGGLADTPPASLAGNVTSLSDPNQPVSGYFIVGKSSRKLFWLDRRDIPAGTAFIGLLGDGRRPNPEPISADLSRPPQAPCVESSTRTSSKPEGWFDFGT